ncbi:MAG: polyprenyl synthetase family protein [Candidatus Bathyarchaeota archaeon]|nr:polyprenyl synthetase family protein [Candidatus Bathyarchaeota archaeon]
MSGGDIIKTKLNENAVRVDAFIDELLKPRRPEVLYEASRHLVMAGGKRLRPYLTVKSCEIVGGKPEDAIPYSAGLEILHNFTLVHDDVMDNDPVRRGTTTVHTKYGIPIAICAGDLLFAKVYEAFTIHAPHGINAKKILYCVEAATRATIELCEGQTLDLSFPDTTIVSEEDYLLMIGGKTSALFRACAEVGAIVGGGSKRQVNALGKFAYAAGISFQIVDDILGIISDENILGKPVGSDLREGKKTLIIIHALKHAKGRQMKILETVLGNKNGKKEDFEEAIQVLQYLGSIDYASKKADRYLTQAKKQLDSFTDSRAKRDLDELITYFTRRLY